MVRQDLEGVGDEQTWEANRVEDAKDPDEDYLGDTKRFRLAMILVLSGHNGPEHEGGNHAYNEEYMSVTSHRLYLSSQAVHTASGDEEERASSHAVD